MPPVRRVSGLRVLSNTAPKMVGEMPLQSNFLFSSTIINALMASVLNSGTSTLSSAKSPPLT